MNDKVDIFVKNMDLSDDLKEYIDKKTPRLERYLDQIDETRIDLAYVKNTRETTAVLLPKSHCAGGDSSCARKNAQSKSSRH